MGQVWRATDTTLGRQVAIKIVPDAFAADPDRLARFERGGGVDTQQFWQYDVAPDGHFLINTVLDEAAAPITLIQNWRPPGEK